jgi:olfactory receptor
VDDFICEEPALIKIACVDKTSWNFQITIATILYMVLHLGIVPVSYGCIVMIVL